MQTTSPLLSLSPSFNTYSSGSKLAEIAARVVEEFCAESQSQSSSSSEFDYFYENFSNIENVSRGSFGEQLFQQSESKVMQEEEDRTGVELKEDDDGEFEFSFVTKEADSSPISADEIFCNGLIRPTFPIFNTDLLLADDALHIEENSNSGFSKPPAPVRLPLRKLFIEERETASCSSSEADELDGVPPGTYCVWKPATAETPAAGCKKSNSTGSSKRWRFRDLLRRSNSHGKDTFVFFTPKKQTEKSTTEVSKLVAGKGNPGAVAGGNGSATAGAQYGKKDGDGRRSFLPYRQDLMGFLANVNGLSRNIHPF